MSQRYNWVEVAAEKNINQSNCRKTYRNEQKVNGKRFRDDFLPQ